jgi:hypothetical protein
MSLKNLHTDELVERWNRLLFEYSASAKSLKKVVDKISLQREELQVIKEELATRKIEVDKEKP